MSGDYSYSEKEKLGRGRWSAKDGSLIGRVRNRVIQFVRRSRLRTMVILGVVLVFIIYMFTRKFKDLNCQVLSKAIQLYNIGGAERLSWEAVKSLSLYLQQIKEVV